MLITDIVLDDNREATVAVVHAEPPSFGADILGLPLGGYDPSLRDFQIGLIRAALEEPLGTGRPVFMLGDFNITDRETAYGDLSRGLTDAQRAVGVGPGATWRPSLIEWLPFGLLRIDMLLTGPAIQPLSIATDCSPRGSDHCILSGVVALSGAISEISGPWSSIATLMHPPRQSARSLRSAVSSRGGHFFVGAQRRPA